MQMTPELLDCLRRIVYHRISMWDAASEAEQLLNDEIEVCTQSLELDDLCVRTGAAHAAKLLTEDELASLVLPNWLSAKEQS